MSRVKKFLFEFFHGFVVGYRVGMHGGKWRQVKEVLTRDARRNKSS